MDDKKAKRNQEANGRDAGSFIGRLPEPAARTIPGGVNRRDERVSATQSRPRGGTSTPDRPDGHREGPPADDATVREAGQDR